MSQMKHLIVCIAVAMATFKHVSSWTNLMPYKWGCSQKTCHEFVLLLQMLSMKRKRQDHSTVAPLQEVCGKKPNSSRRNNPAIGVRKQGQCKSHCVVFYFQL